MTARLLIPTPLRLIAILLTLVVVATLEASLAGPALGATQPLSRGKLVETSGCTEILISANVIK
ncbi:MAG TPA: hypothetical protein VIZ22_10560 [Candidatus Limnocylindrales bacterium]